MTFGLLLGLCVLRAFYPPEVQAQSGEAEYKFKAVYLYNFVQFIEWPPEAFPDADAPLIIGVLGEDPFGALLDQTVAGETANGRRIAIQRFFRIEDVKKSHLLFISKSEKERVGAVLSRLRDPFVVTVSEIEGFAGRGGGINFFIQKGRLRFEINLATSKRTDVKISSKLLRLARIAYSKNAEQGP